MTWRVRLALAVGALLLLVAAFVAGRYSRPARVEERIKVETKTETVVQWKERVVYRKAADTARHIETTTEKEPDGTVKIVRVEDAASHSTTATDTTVAGETKATQSSTQETVKIVEAARPRFALRLGAEWDSVALRPAAYLPGVDLRLAGPLWIGVEARFKSLPKPEALGASIRLEF